MKSSSLFPSKIKNIPLIVGVFYSVSCQADSTAYLCREEGKTGSIAFSWNRSTIHIDHMSFTRWSPETVAKIPITISPKPVHELSANTKRGDYKITVTEDKIIVAVMSGAVYMKIKDSKGNFVDNVPWEEYAKIKRYHVILPVIHEYAFDKRAKNLLLTYTRLMPPSESKLQTFKLRPGQTNYDIINQGPAEASDLEEMMAEELEPSYFSYNCTAESGFISWLRRTLKTIAFP